MSDMSDTMCVNRWKIVSPLCMSPETTEQASCRTLFNVLVRVPTDQRLEAAAAALEVVEEHLGTNCALYRTVHTMYVVCLIHQRIRQGSQQKVD